MTFNISILKSMIELRLYIVMLFIYLVMVDSETNEKVLSESNINRSIMRDNYFVRQYYEYL